MSQTNSFIIEREKEKKKKEKKKKGKLIYM
jgi:hypothetical protein